MSSGICKHGIDGICLKCLMEKFSEQEKKFAELKSERDKLKAENEQLRELLFIEWKKFRVRKATKKDFGIWLKQKLEEGK